ncbi:hypothetical protein Ddye_028513 [Dipteronia dyeriana]|uniref:K Homology domain-containing protein n=1 Tax=Dipteronia dyeriana TaxID=168575 RepID=A0AAD9WJR3_9ROSI|nr:hypothetical protein Ddye_028513 [Dipteronia dyeriana]
MLSDLALRTAPTALIPPIKASALLSLKLSLAQSLQQLLFHTVVVAATKVTRDTEVDLSSPCRVVELMGTSEQISKAEQLINDVLAEIGLVIGKGGETIKNM